jgi:hypothetical protein
MSRTSIFAGLALAVVAAAGLALWLGPAAEPEPKRSPDVEPASKAVERQPLRPVASGEDPRMRPVPEAARRPVRTSTPARAEPSRTAPAGTPEPLVGLDLADASSSDLAALKVPEGVTGVVVRAVDPASPGAHAALKPGDVIARAQRDKITSIDALKASIGTRDYTLLTVYRDGYPFQVVIYKPFQPR